MWNGKLKAITFSSDDGVLQDKRFVEILNKYGLKCTFNINSGMLYNECIWITQGVEIRRMTVRECKEILEGHEIAAHSLTHPTLADLDDYMFERQIVGDKFNLEYMFEKEVCGFALPGGTYDGRLPEICRKFGIKYIRNSKESKNFDIPEDLYNMSGSVKYSSDDVFRFAELFLNSKADHPMLMHIWGHSYEMDIYDSWERFENLCRLVHGKGDVFYGTNYDVLKPFVD